MANYQYWVETDRTLLARVNEMIKDIRRSPFAGIGKPEPLKGGLGGLHGSTGWLTGWPVGTSGWRLLDIGIVIENSRNSPQS